MKILYVVRDRSKRGWTKRLHRWATGFLDGQDGFFEASLHRAGTVTRRRLDEALALGPAGRGAFDAVVVNAKSGLDLTDPAALAALAAGTRQPPALFHGSARAQDMPPQAVVDRLSAVFKREPFADLDRYGLSPANAAKIVPTHLANPLVDHSYRLPRRSATAPLERYSWEGPFEADLFFLGTVAPDRYGPRLAAWRAIRDMPGLVAKGGLIAAQGTEIPADLAASPLPRPAYRRWLMGSRIGLSLEGIGPFTFRHLEVLSVGGFVLSTPSIRPLWLRAPLVEGRDYVAYDDPGQMVELIRHYIADDAARTAIAQAGRAAYERLYDVDAHAAEIRAALRGGGVGGG